MELLRFLNRTLDVIIGTHDAFVAEAQKPHGTRVKAGLHEGARYAAAGGIGLGLAAYAASRYLLGHDEQAAQTAMRYGMVAGAGLGMLYGYTRHGMDREHIASLKNISRPLSSYVRDWRKPANGYCSYASGYGLRFA
jgi:hypothetical protein